MLGKSLCRIIFCCLLVGLSVGQQSVTAGQHSKDDDVVPYVTLRNTIAQPGPDKYYGDERGELVQGDCFVRWEANNLLNKIGDKIDFYVPSGSAEITEIKPKKAAEFWPDFKHKLSGQRPVVYVHGYNISFEKACFRTRQLQHNLGLENRLILFSWPSDGATLNYTRDEADIAWSVVALASLIGDMASHFADTGFDLVGHSLGARGVVLALSRLAQMSQQNAHGRPKVKQLVLMAADIDAALAAQRLPEVRSLVDNITLYTSANDRALKVSENLHGYPRLGQSGAHLSAIDKVDFIDVSALKVQRVSGHLYHLVNRAVITDLDELLNSRVPANRRTQLQRDANQQSRQYRLLKHAAVEDTPE